MRWMALVLVLISFGSINLSAQSGRSTEAGERHYSLNVILQSVAGTLDLGGKPSADPIQVNRNQIELYEAGIEQHIETFRPDLTGARFVFLVDNSQNIHATTAEMEKGARALIKELYVGDRMMMIGFDQAPEILEDFTDDAKKLVEAGNLFRKKSTPRLYDALAAVIEDALRKEIGTTKRVIILISDGYDTGSQVEYEQVLNLLQTENIVMYAFRTSDRTFGAPRSKKLGPKPVDALTGLVEGTGGRIFNLEDCAQGAKVITDEVRNRWFTLTYVPKGTNTSIARRLLVSYSDDKFVMRTKKQQPPAQ